ncbi:MAG: hypothetical protein IKD61_05430 [Oscillospiraceae bacterium]|nr:hypothetical protein [Oscillospiraceae bacterium]
MILSSHFSFFPFLLLQRHESPLAVNKSRSPEQTGPSSRLSNILYALISKINSFFLFFIKELKDEASNAVPEGRSHSLPVVAENKGKIPFSPRRGFDPGKFARALFASAVRRKVCGVAKRYPPGGLVKKEGMEYNPRHESAC